MVGKDLEDNKKHLRERDEHTLERRAARRLELPSMVTDGREDFSQREWDYSSEAYENHIAYHYRSAIFCCACAIDQIFRYEYIKGAAGKEKAIEYLKGITFGRLINEVKNQINSFGNLQRLAPFIEKADLLNQIRNKIAVHPLFVDIPPKEQKYRNLKDHLLAKDLEVLIKLTDKLQPGAKAHIWNRELQTEKGKYSFGEIIEKEFKVGDSYISAEAFWEIIKEDLLRILSFESIKIMKEILEGLYPAP